MAHWIPLLFCELQSRVQGSQGIHAIQWVCAHVYWRCRMHDIGTDRHLEDAVGLQKNLCGTVWVKGHSLPAVPTTLSCWLNWLWVRNTSLMRMLPSVLSTFSSLQTDFEFLTLLYEDRQLGPNDVPSSDLQLHMHFCVNVYTRTWRA